MLLRTGLNQFFDVPVGGTHTVPFNPAPNDHFTVNGDGELVATYDGIVVMYVNVEWRSASDLGGANNATGYRVLSITRDGVVVQSDLDDYPGQFEVARQSMAVALAVTSGQRLAVRVTHDYSRPVPIMNTAATSLTLQVVKPEQALAAVALSGAYDDLSGTPEIPDSPEDIGAEPAGTAAALVAEALANQQPFDLPAGLAALQQAVVGASGSTLAFYGGTPTTRRPALTPQSAKGVDVVSVLGVSVLGGNSAAAIDNLRTRVSEIENALKAYGLLPQ